MSWAKHPFIFLILLFCLFPLVFAHPGRTDANGGHWDRSTGEYHFHSGEYAGRESSGSSSKNYTYDNFTPPYDPPTKNPYKTEKQKSTTDMNKIEAFGSICSFYLFFSFFYFLFSGSSSFKG